MSPLADRVAMVLLVAGAACGPPGDPAAVRAEIDSANQRFMAAFGDLDATTLAGLYTEDAVLLPPNSGPVTGRIGIKEFWATGLTGETTELRLETRELQPADTLAVEMGSYVMRGAGGATVDSGKYLVVWRYDGDQWRLWRDIWNTSAPPVEDTATAPSRR